MKSQVGYHDNHHSERVEIIKLWLIIIGLLTTVHCKVSIKPEVTKDHLESAKINELELESFCLIRKICIKSFIFLTFCECGLFI